MKAPTPKTKILFVCSGDTCRSPMAAIIFRNICRKHHKTGVVVHSAGTNPEVGSDVMPEVIIALQTYGEKIPVKPHRARQYLPTMQQEYQYIIDLREYEDPYGRGQAAYDYLCCKMQVDLEQLFQKLFGVTL